MKQEDRNLLVDQVLKVIQREKGNEDYNYYGDFFNECIKFNLSETAFRQTILRLSFERLGAAVEEDPEQHIPNLNKFVDLFDKRCYNLFQLGRVLFEHPSRAEEYLEDGVFIKHDVTFLSSNSTLGLDIARVFKAEADPYNRFLRIVYRLNHKLPFRIGNEVFQNIPELLARAGSDFGVHTMLADEFSRGRLQVWMEETHQEGVSQLPAGKHDHDFLAFVFGLDSQYPFYFQGTPIRDPLELAASCKEEINSWTYLFEYMKNGQLAIWFTAIGKADWLQGMATDEFRLDQLGYLQGEDKKMTLVQLLLHRIDPGFKPVLKPKTGLVSLLAVGSTDAFEQVVPIKLVTKGFVIAGIRVDRVVEGVEARTEALYFYDLPGHVEHQIRFRVDPSRMTRNKLYQFTVFVETVFETLEIKVELKVVFPLARFLVENLKYVLLLAALFAASRVLVGIEFPGWLGFYGDYFLRWSDVAFLPFHFYYFGAVFFLLIVALLFLVVFLVFKNHRYGRE